MKKVYFEKTQNTNDKTITKFYYNKFKAGYDNLEFLKDKISELLKSPKSTDGIKNQLARLSRIDLSLYDCFYIYSNKLCFGIKTESQEIDFYDNNYDTVIQLNGYTNNYNCRLPGASRNTGADTEIDTIDTSDFE